jgi:hypothetical protein
MMGALQWIGFAGTFGGYLTVLHWSRFWGTWASLLGVTSLGVWAYFEQAWGVFGLEMAFIATNVHAIAQELRR